MGGFLEGSLLGPDCDPDTLQTSPGSLPLTSPQRLLWGPPRHALEIPSAGLMIRVVFGSSGAGGAWEEMAWWG